MPIDPNFTTLWFSSLALILGLGLLILGGEFLISGAAKIALHLGMSPLLIGLTVVAFGTSMPELFVSLNASFSGHSDIMLGNVVGSNIANVGLVLAFSALLAPLAVNFRSLRTELYLIITASLTLFALTYWGIFPRIIGLLFVCTLLFYTFMAYRHEHHQKKNNSDAVNIDNGKTPYSFITLLVVGGLILMWFGSDYFIKGAVDIARRFGLSELVIGLTLAAVGTSLPELASCVSAVRRKEGDILVGNIVGSNLFNLLLVLGCTAFIKPFTIPMQAVFRDLPVMLAYSAVLIPIAIFGKKIHRWQGGLFMVCYVIYIYSLK